MALSPEVLVRIDAMLNRGQIHSEPATLSSTDIMLDRLDARRRATSSRHGSAAAGVSSAIPTLGEAKRRHDVNWLDLPSLPELLNARRRLL